MIIVIHGPMGCGKTHNARRLADYNGCVHIHDVSGGTAPTPGALKQLGDGDHLVLTTTDEAQQLIARYWRMPGGVKLIPYDVAAKRAGIAA